MGFREAVGLGYARVRRLGRRLEMGININGGKDFGFRNRHRRRIDGGGGGDEFLEVVSCFVSLLNGGFEEVD